MEAKRIDRRGGLWRVAAWIALSLLTLASLDAIGVGDVAAAPARGAVSTPFVTLSSTAAAATAVTYTVQFSAGASGPIPAGGSITLAAPAGTIWPASALNCDVSLVDSTTSSGSFTCASQLHVSDPGLPLSYAALAGDAMTVVVPNAIAAGDSVTLQVVGVVNPAPGAGALQVWTSGDPTPVASSSYTITTAGAVSTPVVSLSSTAAAASAVTYDVAFTTSATGAIPTNGTITLTAPPGTMWPGSGLNCDVSLVDSTTPADGFSCAARLIATDAGLPLSFASIGGRRLTLVVPNAIAAGDHVTLQIEGVANPGVGAGAVQVSTSADPTPTSSASYAITAAAAVSTPAVTLSSSAATATAVTYDVGFSTSATGAIPAGGTITLTAPPGTLWPGTGVNCDVTLVDSTAASGSFACASHLVETDPGLPLSFASSVGRRMTVVVPNAIAAGDSVTLQIQGVTNPAAGTGSLQVSTSADPTPAFSASYTITPPTAVSTPAVSLSSTAAAASAVTYTISFDPSATGAIPAGGAIVLIAPVGTLWPGSGLPCEVSLTDATTPAGSFSCASRLVESDTGALLTFSEAAGRRMTVVVPNAIAAGDRVTLHVQGVANPGAGPGAVQVSTSADATPVSSSGYTIVAADAVSKPAVSFSSTVAAASGVTYTVGFSVSATGAIQPGGTITLTAPAGTVWPQNVGDYALTDVTTPAGSSPPNQVVVAGGGESVTLVLTSAIAAGDQLSLAVSGVTNPGAGSDSLDVATSSDPRGTASASYTLTGATQDQTSVTGLTFAASSDAGGAGGVTDTISFTTSAGAGGLIGGSGTITLAAPAGTTFESCPYGCGGGNATYTIADATHPSGSGAATPAVGGVGSVGAGSSGVGSVVSLTPVNTIQAGDLITITVTQVVNPPTGGGGLTISTSSDTQPVSVTATAPPPSSVSGVTVSSSSTAGGASGVTEIVGLTTSPVDGELVGGEGSITLAAPTGILFGSCPYGCGGGNATYTIVDSTHPSGSGSASPAQIGGAGSVGPSTDGVGSVVSLTPANTIQAGDQITITITQVTNAPAGAGTLTVTTSSDLVPVSVSDATVSPGQVSGVSLSTSTQAGGAAGVTETLSLTTSASGGGELLGGASTITLAAPAGTLYGPCPYGCGGGNPTYTIVDSTHPSGSGSAFPVQIAGAGSLGSYSAGAGSVVSLQPSNTIQAGDQITITITQVTNAPVGTGSLTVSTSSDPQPVTVADNTVAPQQAGDVSLLLTNPATGLSLTLSCSSTPARASTTVTVDGPTAVAYGAPDTYQAIVDGSAPTGTVTFYDGSTDLGSSVLDGGSASSTVGPLAIGPHSITASYAGDAANQPATSPPLAVTVAAPSTTTTTSATTSTTSSSTSSSTTTTVTTAASATTSAAQTTATQTTATTATTGSVSVSASQSTTTRSAQPASVCGAPGVDLLDAYVQGGRLRLVGYADPQLAGSTVAIQSTRRKVVAHAIVSADGYFSASAASPAAAARASAATRYVASIGAQRSAAVALGRRVYVYSVTRQGAAKVRITGQLVAPLTHPVAPVTVLLRTSCQTAYTRAKATVTVDRRSGAFTVLASAPPADAPGAVYELRTRVATGHGGHASSTVTTLPRPVT